MNDSRRAVSAARWLGLILFVIGIPVVLMGGESGLLGSMEDRLRQAMVREDMGEVQRVVRAACEELGPRVGMPEVADPKRSLDGDGPLLTPAEAKESARRLVRLIRKRADWRVGMDPTQLSMPLRVAASVVTGCSALEAAGLEPEAKSLARESADFLIWAQEQAETGGFPFPANRDRLSDPAFAAAAKALARAEAKGELNRWIQRGWIVNDNGNGGLQFDNGEAGVAMLGWYRVTHEKRYLESALRAAEWAMAQPVVPNWNYNSFSVTLLAKVYNETKDSRFLVSALKKVRLGVLPGQLREGVRAGRWFDPHNARPAYHYLLLRSLVACLEVLPADHPERLGLERALKLGLEARNRDFIVNSAPNIEVAFEVLMALEAGAVLDRVGMEGTGSERALWRLLGWASMEARGGRVPMAPGVWGVFLARCR